MTRLALASAFVLLVGCTNTAYSPEDETPQPPVARSTGTLIVKNESDMVVYRVRVARVEEGSWSDDRLDGAEVIKPGEERGFEVFSGRYNVHVEFKDGSVNIDDEIYTVGSDNSTVCVIQTESASELGTLTIVNRTGFAICRVFFSLTNSMGWGEDRLVGNQVLAPRRKLSWEVPAGNYNLKVEFQDGTSLEGESAYEVLTGETAVYRLGTH